MITSDNADKHRSIGNKPIGYKSIGNKITKPLNFSGFVAFGRVELTAKAFTSLVSCSFLIFHFFSVFKFFNYCKCDYSSKNSTFAVVFAYKN